MRVEEPAVPFPPPNLLSRIGPTPDPSTEEGREFFDSTGRDRKQAIIDLLPDGYSLKGRRVLDFGCGAGRVLRHFVAEAGQAEFWGCDLHAPTIEWLSENLSPPMRFFVNDQRPLPQADGYFDLVYGLSVFTHISELADAWFLELLRIVRPGGHIWLTIHDEHTVDFLLDPEREGSLHGEMVDLLRALDDKTGVLDRDWVYFSVLADPAAQVFHNSDHLVARWSTLANCVAVKPEATGYQTALVFEKPAS
jgi:SAM-dependent methyltransferase